jgi:hypothetical protein
MLVPEIKAQHDSDKSADRVVLAHGPKARPKHDTVDFYSGRADLFDPSCCVPGLARHAMNSPMTSTTALATAADMQGHELPLPLSLPRPIHA